MFWLILLGLIGLTALGVALVTSGDWEIVGLLVSVFSGVVLLLLLIMWPINYMICKDLVNARYPAIEATLETSRDTSLDPLERTTIQKQVMELNSEIKSCQYWNQTSFDPMYPDEVMELELLK